MEMKWTTISMLLCFIGFLKEIKPSDLYYSDFMQKPYRDVTYDEVIFFILNFHQKTINSNKIFLYA